MKQKIVINLVMTCDKCRSKAMELVAGTCGVESVEIPPDSDKVVVVGNVDSIKLTTRLRKKVGPAHLVEVSDATKKEDKKKPPECPWPWTCNCPHCGCPLPCYCPPYPRPIPVVCDLSSDNACTIM